MKISLLNTYIKPQIVMLKQIFRENVPISFLFDLLERICLKTEKYFLIDQNAYKKLTYMHHDEPFLKTILPYYQISKQFYVTRKCTYNSFINIIRQICKSNDIMFASKIHYNESKYNIDYFIYF